MIKQGKQLLTITIFTLLLGVMTACKPAVSPTGISVQDAWMRTVQSGETGGVFMKIENHGSNDRLLRVETGAAEQAEMHETRMEGDVMQMRPVEALEIPGGQAVELKPGGLHLMLVGMKQSVSPGDSLPLTLVFEQYGPVEVQVEVRNP